MDSEIFHHVLDMMFTEGKFALIPVGKDNFSIIDADMLSVLGKHSWALTRGYAVASVDGKSLRMHNLILAPRKNREINHKNRCPLDNRRSNLRYATRSQQCMNRSFRGEVGYKGVNPVAVGYTRRWSATICKEGERFNLGTYPTAIAAAMVYDNAARALFGDFAVLNFG